MPPPAVPLISIVIPVYQNERSLAKTCADIAQTLDAHTGDADYEIVFVNDGSTDGSWGELIRLQAARPKGRIRIIDLVQNYGQRAALLAGYRHARGDCIVSLSADLQDPASLIWDFVQAWRSGHRLVVGGRIQRNDGWLYDRVAGLAWRLFRKIALPTMPTGGFDYFLMDRQVGEAFLHEPEQGMFMQGRLLHLAGAPHVIPYARRARADSRPSQTSLSRRLQYFIDGIAGYSYLPLRLMSLTGILVFCGGIAASSYIVWHVIHHGSKIEGWASLAVMVLLLNGLMMLFMGVMGEYVWRTLAETRRRPHYVVKQTVD